MSNNLNVEHDFPPVYLYIGVYSIYTCKGPGGSYIWNIVSNHAGLGKNKDLFKLYGPGVSTGIRPLFLNILILKYPEQIFQNKKSNYICKRVDVKVIYSKSNYLV